MLINITEEMQYKKMSSTWMYYISDNFVTSHRLYYQVPLHACSVITMGFSLIFNVVRCKAI